MQSASPTPSPSTPSLTDLLDDEVRTIALKRTAKSVKVDDLVPGTTYQFTLTGKKPSVKIVKKITIVAKPTAVTSFSMLWTQKDAMGVWTYSGPKVQSWSVSYTSADGKISKTLKVDSLFNTFKVSNLSKTSGYSFTLRGTNAAGSGPKVTDTLAAVAPSTPKSVKAVVSDDAGTSATITWGYEGPLPSGFKVLVKGTGLLRDGDVIDANAVARTATIDRLSTNGSYTFSVTATNSHGTATGTSTPLVLAKPVPAPSGLSATGANASVALKWSAPVAEATNPITGYVVETSTDNGSTWTETQVKSTATAYSVTGLTNGTSYLFRVSASTAKGVGKPSVTAAAAAGVAPGAPSNVKVTSALKSLILTWSAPTAASLPITGYKVEYKKATDTNWLSLAETTALTATLTSLDSVNYNVRISAVTSSGPSTPSSIVAAVPGDNPGAPVLTAPVTSTTGSVALTWTLANDGGSKITAYKVEQQIGEGSWTVLGGSTAITTTSFSATGLVAGSSYKFRVSATNVYGTGGFSNTVTVAASSVPGAPVVTATPSSNQVSLSWTTPATNGSALTFFRVERAATGSSVWTVLTETLAATATSYVSSTGIVNGSGYQFRVSAQNAAGWGATSAVVTAIPASVPAAITGVVVEPSVTTARVRWTAPTSAITSTGGSAITGVVVSYRIGSGSWTAATAVAANVAQLDISGLTPATTYEFKVVASNAIGAGADSTLVTGRTVALPQAPTDLAGVGKDGSVELSWAAPAEPITPLLGTAYKYRVEYSTDGATWTLAVENITALVATISSLRNGSQYSFRISAGYTINAAVTYGVTAQVLATPRGTPGAPEAFNATQLTETSVRLNWNPPTNNGGGFIEGYDVSYTRDGSSWSATTQTSSNTVEVTGLTGGLTYTFRILTRNTFASSGYVTTELRTVAAPGAVTGLATGTIGSQTVPLSWTANPVGDAVTGYKVEYSTDGTLFTTATANTAATSYTVTGLTNGTSYTFRVTAINAGGMGTSSSVSGTPIGAMPVSNLTGTAGDGSVTLQWSSPANGGATVSGIRVRFSSNSGTSWTVHQASLAAGTTSTQVTGLSNGTAYTFEVVALTNLGDSTAVTTTNTPVTPPPSSPQNLSVTSTTTSSVGLSWSAPASGGAVTYRIEQRPSVGGEWALVASSITDTSYTVSSLMSNEAYDFNVFAVNASGSSAAASVSQLTATAP
jgi:hypothetical protein